MFDKFYRVDNSDRREIKGTGLGLAICKQLVTIHGGQIWAESDGLGSGTRVHVTLPLAGQSLPVGEVLIVEDDHGFDRLAAEELETHGLTSTTVTSVEAALDHLAGHTPRAILLDLLFPDKRQGESLLAELAGSVDRHIPLVIVTVKDLDASQQSLLKGLGARAIFRKGPRASVDAARAIARSLAEEPLLQEGGQA
jgi:CheY-like chemotaxis protein